MNLAPYHQRHCGGSARGGKLISGGVGCWGSGVGGRQPHFFALLLAPLDHSAASACSRLALSSAAFLAACSALRALPAAFLLFSPLPPMAGKSAAADCVPSGWSRQGVVPWVVDPSVDRWVEGRGGMRVVRTRRSGYVYWRGAVVSACLRSSPAGDVVGKVGAQVRSTGPMSR